MKFIMGLFGLAILFYLCFLPIYAIFYNSSEDTVKDMSLESSYQNFIKIEKSHGMFASKGDKDSLLRELKNIKEVCLKEGIDISKPLYSLLSENKEVSGLKIIDPTKEEFGMLSPLADQAGGGKIFIITWKLNGRQYNLPVIVIPPSFFKVRKAIAWAVNGDNIFKQVYGLH